MPGDTRTIPYLDPTSILPPASRRWDGVVGACMRRVLAAGIVNLVLTVAPASPAIRARHECLIAFDGVAAGAGSERVFCRDGDPHCDVDGAVDGHCTFHVRLCVNVRGVAGCRP